MIPHFSKTVVLSAFSALAVLTVAAGVRAQFTPGSGGYTAPQPVMPMAPLPPRPVTPPPMPSPAGPGYSWETPGPGPQVITAPQAADPDAAVRVMPGAVYYDPAQYVQTPQGLLPRLSDAQVGDLTGSVALYPDPLLAEMLPASTYVEQLAYADRWLQQHPGADERAIQALPLDDSVQSIMHYPTVLSLMVEHLDWTQALGISFLYQRDDVMNSIQRWRTMAVSYGTLASSPQLDVYQRGGIIEIVPPPAQQVIYVPVYDPQVVYVRPLRPLSRSAVTFREGGLSLSFVFNDVDWRGHDVHVPVRHDWDHDWDHGDRGGRGGGGGGDRGGGGRSGGGSGGGTAGGGTGGTGGGGGGAGGGRSGGGSGGGTAGGGTGGTGGGGRSGGGTGGTGGGGRSGGGNNTTVIVNAPATTPPEKTKFIHEATKAPIMYPDKFVTPTADKKVFTTAAATRPTITTTKPLVAEPVISGRARGRGVDTGRGADDMPGRGLDNGPGRGRGLGG